MHLLSTLLAFAAALGILVVVHEMGHYLAARWVGVKVLRFSVGFGHSLITRRWGQDATEWSLAVIPLGGYVKMLDEREAPVAAHEVSRAFNRQTVWARMLIVIAGPVANLLLAVLLYWGLFLHGVPAIKPVLAEPTPASAAALAGLHGGDVIASVADDMNTKLWDAATGDCLATWGDYKVKTPQGFPSMLYAVAFSADGEWLATGDRTGRILVRDATSGQIAATLETPVMYTWDPTARRHSIGGIRSLAFSNDSRQLAVGGMGKVGNIDHLEGVSRIEIFNWQTAERRLEIEDSKYKGLVEALQFGSDDAFLIAAGGDNSGFISVYNTADGKLWFRTKRRCMSTTSSSMPTPVP